MPTPILIILALVVLSILILVHEFGHMIAARLIGVWVEEFGIGLPPKVWSKKIGETEYSINALPLGGFVKLHGETPDLKVKYPDRSFRNKSRIARAFVALAGIFMNLAFAVVCLALTFSVLGVDRGATIVSVEENATASELALLAGDEVVSIAGVTVDRSIDFSRTVESNAGETVDLVVSRGTEEISFALPIASEYIDGKGFTGISFEATEIVYPPVWQQPFVYTYYGFLETSHWTNKTVEGFVTLFGQLRGGSVPQGIAGPLGVTLTIAEILKYGIVNALTFTAIISINLAVINLLPFPPLDGSRVALLIVEAVVGKKRLGKYEFKILEIGMAILLLLILVLTITEIPKLIQAGSISGFVDTLFGAAN